MAAERKNMNVVMCPVYPGLTETEALQLRFGDAGAPPDMQLILVVNAIPPDGVDYDWAEAPRDSLAFRAAWERLSCGHAVSQITLCTGAP